MAEDWDGAYRTGRYRSWDYGVASQEVVACAVLGIFPPNGVILDVGCGSGSDAVFLTTIGFHVKALDVSSAALDLLKKKAAKAGVRVETVHGDATKMPIEDSSIDFALDRGLLHNLDDDEGAAYAMELARVLKRGAGFLVRGARVSYNGNFYPMKSKRLNAMFPERLFSIGRVLPMAMISDADEDRKLDGAIALIRRR